MRRRRSAGWSLVAVLALLLPLQPAQAEETRLLYVARAPKDRDGFRTLQPSLEVFDIANGHRLVRVIPLQAPPGTAPVAGLRGITASAATHRLYLSHYGSFAELRHGAAVTGHVLCLDLETGTVLWNRPYAASVDRGAVTPDGARLFMPSGELSPTPYFYVIDGADGGEQEGQRIGVAPYTHNTVVTLDGSRVFMTAFGAFDNDRFEPWVHVADAASGRVVGKIGPFAAHVRPITVNGAGTLVFANVNKLLGFQVGDVRTGRVLYTVQAPADRFPPPQGSRVVSHGISMTADETEVWVVDQERAGVHAFDVSGLPGSAPAWKRFIETHDGSERDAAGEPLYGERRGILNQPGWIMSSIDGRYFYPETGEVIDTAAGKIVGQLVGANGLYVHSRFALEVVFDRGRVVRVGDQQGVGRVGADVQRSAGSTRSPIMRSPSIGWSKSRIASSVRPPAANRR